MAVELTNEQRKAVEAPVSNNLVSAAAGSGKTKVLSERIVRRIKSGDTTIDRLLIVTFTRAAAAQMRERIGKAIEEEYKKTGLHSLRRQLSMVAGADICTIDSFCINLVKRNFFRVDVPPDFVIADSNEMKILREEVLIEVLEEMYASSDSEFLLLAEGLGNGKTDDELKDAIMKAYLCTRSFENPDAWLDQSLNFYVEGTKENNLLYSFVASEIKDRIKELKKIIYATVRETENAGIESYISIVMGEKERFDRYLLNCSEENFKEAFECFEFSSFPGGRRKEEEGMKAEKKYIQSMHNDAKSLFSDIKKLYDVYTDEKGVSYLKIRALVKCVKLFDRLYTEEKLSRKMLEFSDCEYLALKILKTGEDVCNELRDKYDEIYIDEYQDTNPLQDALFTMMSRESRGEPNVFIVGDVKQSIYRFRHSDPRVFAEKSRTFGKDENSCKMILSKNFRSRREVVDSVNCVFEKIMREETAQIEYDDEHKLRCGAKYIEYNKNRSELHILHDNYDTEDMDELLESEQREAIVAAERIKKLIEEGFLVSDDGKMRPVRYSDIAILSPKINNKAEAIVNIFNTMGVPVYCESKQNFFDLLEVRSVVSLLRCVDNPLCDIPLASVMRSPMFNFDENELTQIRLPDRNCPFYENVCAMAKEKTRLGKKCKKFISTLEFWRQSAQVLSLERFVTRLIDESGYYSFVGALPGGGIRQANLRRLVALAAGYESGCFKGLYNFVRYIDKTIEHGGEIEADICRSDDSVLITSIHKSKGLEFPVVIVIGCGGNFNDRDSYDSLIISPECGMAITEREKGRRVKFKSAEYSAISMMIVRDNHAEQMRLLYVAMTRAKEKLIMIGTTKKIESIDNKRDFYSDADNLSSYKIRSMRNYLDYIYNSISDEYWDVFVVNDLPALVENKVEFSDIEQEYEAVSEVLRRLNYVYPYSGRENIPSKMSVSEIKKMSVEQDESVSFFKPKNEKRVPEFLMEDKKLTGANRGTAYHRVMELIDLNEKDVAGAIENFVENGFMTCEQADCIDVEKIEKFLSSPIAERMRNAKRVMRETSFTIAVDAKDIFDEGENEKICVQGTVDCLFEENDGKIILLDYKTDTYSDPDEIIKRYKKQLELYEVAIFSRFGQNCGEKCLYMFQNGDIINV